MKHITLIQGHPDNTRQHLCHVLADAYLEGAESAGHSISTINIAELEFPLIRSKEEFEQGKRPADIQQSQGQINNSDHLVLVYPLWLGTMPAMVKGFLEQVFRYDFAFQPQPGGRFEKKLTGKSARIIITMGMPALAYRWYFGAHSLKNLERNILKFSGIRPVKESLFGMVDNTDQRKLEKWSRQMARLGKKAV